MAPYSVINAIMLSDKKAQSIDKCNKVDGSLRFCTKRSTSPYIFATSYESL